jgi:hypothetical protein
VRGFHVPVKRGDDASDVRESAAGPRSRVMRWTLPRGARSAAVVTGARAASWRDSRHAVCRSSAAPAASRAATARSSCARASATSWLRAHDAAHGGGGDDALARRGLPAAPGVPAGGSSSGLLPPEGPAVGAEAPLPAPAAGEPPSAESMPPSRNRLARTHTAA